jgi:hypothetical protein
VPPLLAARAHTHLQECLGPTASPRIITAALQALKSLAISASIEGIDDSEPFSLGLFDEGRASIFPTPQQRGTVDGERQLKLAISIVALCASAESARADLAEAGE